MTYDIGNTNNLEKNSNELYDLTEERPVGWSVSCLDETIFYYLDCNYVNMCNLENDDLNTKT
uniref:hypothetical protein n=1 Tax=Pseudoerythrocladia kornmannii TaxID=753682 RepID=UPI001FCCC518|nr:hypothetical protein MW575_pgp025 [Pseudoerythrocladia kornmannii]UNJ16835.1 hypothetical protein [Pseudoerythrocladia kornmannii]